MNDMLVTLVTYPSSHRARYLKIRLEVVGIECHLENDDEIKSNEGVKVKVNPEDVEKAVSVMMLIKEEHLEKAQKASDGYAAVNKILLPVDFSMNSINAAHYALSFAETVKAEIMLLHVLDQEVIKKNDEEIIIHNEDEAKLLIQEFIDRIEAKRDEEGLKNIPIKYSLIKGGADQMIAKISEEFKPDMIILGTSGKNGAYKGKIGSVSSKVIEASKFPIVIVPGMVEVKNLKGAHVIYVTNFNDVNYSTVNHLMRLIARFAGKVYCLHIEKNPSESINKKMNNVKSMLNREYPENNIECRVINNENLFEGTHNFAKENNIDIISFSSPRHASKTTLFKPENLKNMIITSLSPVIVFRTW